MFEIVIQYALSSTKKIYKLLTSDGKIDRSYFLTLFAL
ncbi:unnamed protein product [Paramecium octaurelia]|uniref:Uncharacterized protein n=1 Tax=Paramecium octaurelia TaxID=43137 RepID=A0A8S1UDQ9_PAROT|nr:unnamed protein product [Paramecium octaurelia]